MYDRKCFRARRTGDGQNADQRRGARGYGVLTLLRTGDCRGQDVVAESFMRSSVVFENDDPLRLAKLYFGNGFFGPGSSRCGPRPQSGSRRLRWSVNIFSKFIHSFRGRLRQEFGRIVNRGFEGP
jgi:hypothetical protein